MKAAIDGTRGPGVSEENPWFSFFPLIPKIKLTVGTAQGSYGDKS